MSIDNDLERDVVEYLGAHYGVKPDEISWPVEMGRPACDERLITVAEADVLRVFSKFVSWDSGRERAPRSFPHSTSLARHDLRGCR